jgi:hypothetical protein
MSSPRQIVRDYLEASEDLMKLEDLTYAETEVVQEMLDRLSEKFNSEHDD